VETAPAAETEPEPVPAASEAPAEESQAEGTSEPTVDATAEATEETAPAAPVVSSGEAHTPRTDADINGAGSLFDL
jgi:hypothetical protein